MGQPVNQICCPYGTIEEIMHALDVYQQNVHCDAAGRNQW